MRFIEYFKRVIHLAYFVEHFNMAALRMGIQGCTQAHWNKA